MAYTFKKSIFLSRPITTRSWPIDQPGIGPASRALCKGKGTYSRIRWLFGWNWLCRGVHPILGRYWVNKVNLFMKECCSGLHMPAHMNSETKQNLSCNRSCKDRKKCRVMSDISTFSPNGEEMSQYWVSNVDTKYGSLRRMPQRKKVLSYVCRLRI